VEDADRVTEGTKVGFTVICLFADVVPHEPPLVVNVNVAVPLNAAGGVHVAFNVVAFGLNVPPTPPSDHVPPVAPPPTEPPNAPEIPPWHIAVIAPPAFTVGVGFTVICLLTGAIVPHEPPLSVNVKVIVPDSVAEAV